MPRAYGEHYQRKRDNLSDFVDTGEIHPDDADAIFELVDAFDEERPTASRPQWPDAPDRLCSYRAKSTLANWLYMIGEYARRTHLLDTDVHTLNKISEEWLRGDDDYKTDDDGMTKGSIRAYQNCLRMFYRYHDDHGIHYEDIVVFDQNDVSIDPRDMLDPKEVAEIRKAPSHPRDKVILDMLLYTGLRNNALRTLRVKDVRPDEGEFYFNTDAEGLKNIDQPNAPRPLLGAEASARTWLEYHPWGDDPDAYFIVGKKDYGPVDPHEQISDRTIERVMNTIKEEAEIDKPLHPHAVRHNFVTICKREYGLDDGTIKFLIGHTPDSTVMETTYAHLDAADHRKKAEEAAGIREPDEERSLSPEFCNSCGEPMPSPDAKACPSCGTVYTPDAKAVEQQLTDTIYDGQKEASDEAESSAVDSLKAELREDPELRAEIIEELANHEYRHTNPGG